MPTWLCSTSGGQLSPQKNTTSPVVGCAVYRSIADTLLSWIDGTHPILTRHVSYILYAKKGRRGTQEAGRA
jgi:hypothetical protein